MPAVASHAKTESARRWIGLYQIYKSFEDHEPTTVCLYACDSRWGGPEEGGWYFECGTPLRTVCVFSKKQAIQAAIDLEAYAKSEIGEETDHLGWPAWRIRYDNQYAKFYPETRPHYE